MHEDPYKPMPEAELRMLESFYHNPNIRRIINEALYWRARALAAEVAPTAPVGTNNDGGTTMTRPIPTEADLSRHWWRYPYSDIHWERIRAHAKHAGQSIEAIAYDDPRFLPILVEGVGEVAKALTEREGRAALRAELVQVAAVAAAWIDAIDAGGRV